MSKTKKSMMILALLSIVSVGLKAQETPAAPEETTPAAQVKVLYSDFVGGTVEATAFDGQKVIIAVTPAENYYIAMSDIEVVAVKDPASATRGDESMPVASALELTLVDAEGNAIVDEKGGAVTDPDDLTSARFYSFVVPEGLGAWVCKADFHEVDKPVTSGSLNDDVLWEVTGDEGAKTLILSGKGDASLDAKKSEKPWDTFSPDITDLVIEEGIESIGDGLLEDFTALKTITLEGKKYVSLGKNKLTKDLTVDVYGVLYNKYKADADWGAATIASSGSVEMKGVAFGTGNDYDVFVSSVAMLIPSELLAFTVSAIDGSNVKISEIEDGIIPADVPVLLLSKEINDDDFRTVTTEDTGKATSGLLKFADKGGQKVALGEVFLLYNDVFYLSQEGTIPEGGVYLAKSEAKDQISKTRSFLTIGDDNTTAIIDVSRLSSLTSRLSGAWYSLDGRRLNTAPTRKGVYVVGGKKVMVK